MDSNVEIKKKRGRKKKVDLSTSQDVDPNITISIEESDGHPVAPTENAPKKRGRKPKGGKLIEKVTDKSVNSQPIANVILHLKCSMQDLIDHNNKISQIVTDPLSYNPAIPPSIMTYSINERHVFSNYQTEESAVNYAYNDFDNTVNKQPCPMVCQTCSLRSEIEDNPQEEDDDINMKDVNAKLKRIKLQLYKNTNPDKKSACFWCTYDFDNQVCYIPKYEMDGQLYGYGSFCRPECAVSYLMKENIDDSTKFERYHLLNQIYSKVYDYKKNIKPAPNPYYLLDKFYGNLSIQEYRKLLKSEHMLLVIEKPMTRILPELHEDSEDFIMNIYGSKQSQTGQQNQTGIYKVKRQSEKQKGPSKSTIMKENFGLV